MYALNTFFRLVRFISNAFIGLFVGFVAGYLLAKGGLSLGFIDSFLR